MDAQLQNKNNLTVHWMKEKFQLETFFVAKFYRCPLTTDFSSTFELHPVTLYLQKKYLKYTRSIFYYYFKFAWRLKTVFDEV